MSVRLTASFRQECRYICLCLFTYFLLTNNSLLIDSYFRENYKGKLLEVDWHCNFSWLKCTCIVDSESIQHYLDQPWAMDSCLIGWQGNLLSASYIQSNNFPTAFKTMKLTVKDKNCNIIKSCLENGLMLYQKLFHR